MLRMPRPPALLAYHGVGRTTQGADPYRLVTAPEHLDAHIRFLRRFGYRFLTAEQLLDETGGDRAPDGVAVLTFDDGWADAVDTVMPLLDRHGVVATFYVCTDWLGRSHPLVGGEAAGLLDAEAVRPLVDAGMEVGSHSRAHRDLRALDDDELAEDLTSSKAAIEALTDRPCRTFAYPYGAWDDRVAAAVRAAGYELAFGWGPGPWRRHVIPRLPAPPRHGAPRLALKLFGVRRRAA